MTITCPVTPARSLDRPQKCASRRWFEAADYRHTTDGPRVCVGDEVPTLCGVAVVAVAVVPGRYAPECAECDRQWRLAEGIPQREEHLPMRRAS